ncbi:MAG: TetR family transcriptional regulator C-terminal domain-containing protein [Pseudomonadota bacterium]
MDRSSSLTLSSQTSVADAPAKPRSRIQTLKRKAITDAALEVFAAEGYRGASVERIAERADMSKTNLLYYFPSKEDVYREVLEQTVEGWLEPFEAISADGEPVEELRRYITAKLEMSARNPEGSRLFSNEIQRGAPLIMEFLQTRLKTLVDDKCGIIRQWIDEGRLAPVDPYHLVFTIWATTQHYADFEVQIGAIMGGQASKPGFEDQAAHAVLSIILNGIRPKDIIAGTAL